MRLAAAASTHQQPQEVPSDPLPNTHHPYPRMHQMPACIKSVEIRDHLRIFIFGPSGPVRTAFLRANGKNDYLEAVMNRRQIRNRPATSTRLVVQVAGRDGTTTAKMISPIVSYQEPSYTPRSLPCFVRSSCQHVFHMSPSQLLTLRVRVLTPIPLKARRGDDAGSASYADGLDRILAAATDVWCMWLCSVAANRAPWTSVMI